MDLTFNDWLNILQTIILLLTGIVVAWYTIETVRIRKETSVQNTLLAEQLRTMQASLKHDLDREANFIRPFFRFESFQHADVSASGEFINKGGTAKNINVKPLGSFRLTINPSKLIDSNEKGRLKIWADNLKHVGKCPFEITCADKLGKTHSFKFYYNYGEGVYEDDSK